MWRNESFFAESFCGPQLFTVLPTRWTEATDFVLPPVGRAFPSAARARRVWRTEFLTADHAEYADSFRVFCVVRSYISSAVTSPVVSLSSDRVRPKIFIRAYP